MTRTTSLSHAQAHLAELVDAAEHGRERIVILRDGKPAAAIVPLQPASAPRLQSPSDSEGLESLRRFIAEIGSYEPGISAVDDLIAGRR